MSFNVQGGAELALEVFGGRVTEMTPPDMPENVSPDEQDNAFRPGSVFSRPGLKKVFATPVGTHTFTYGKSYVSPTGEIRNLYFDATAGMLLVEDPIAAPGMYSTLLSGLAKNAFLKSITANGREYLALSDGQVGADVPLQWDGTNIDRVTQEGPGAAPTVTNKAFAAVALGTGTAGTIPAVPPNGEVNVVADAGTPMNSTFLDFSFPAGTAASITTTLSGQFSTGDPGDCDITVEISTDGGATFSNLDTFPAIDFFATPVVAGAGPYDLAQTIIRVTANAGWVGGDSSTVLASVASCVANISGGGSSTLERTSNVVLGTTAADHNLKVGYLAQISGVAAEAIGGGIDTVTIKNEDSPGIATVKTTADHGLVPGNVVSLNVTGVAVGGGIASATVQGGLVILVMNSAHGLAVGQIVKVAGTATPAYGDGQWVVSGVPSATSFSYQIPADLAYHTGANSGTVTLVFPAVSANPEENLFEVQTAPSSKTFTVALAYPDGTWSGGSVTLAWDGQFYVTSVPTARTFTYQQYGPDLSTTSAGTVTPYGQIAPGKHQLRVSFLRRQGGLTAPGPAVTFEANGGQYLQVDDLAIGPPDVIARVIQLTGALGAYFFYLPVPGRVNGQQVSTATQVQDNTTTSVLLDVSDNTLFAGIGTSIPGNNLPAQIVIDGALGFGSYNTRLLTYGQRNRLQSFLGMGFESGYLSGNLNLPLGWTALDTRGLLIDAPNGRPGMAWQVTAPAGLQSGKLQQTGYLDSYGAPILQAATKYNLRFWASAVVPGGNVATTEIFFRLTSATEGVLASAALAFAAGTTAGKFYDLEAAWTTPAVLPEDVMVEVFVRNNDAGGTSTVVLDEMSVIYNQSPTLPQVLYASYGNNPEGIDGVTGKTGPEEDTRALMDFSVLRNTLYMLTQEPSGRLHEVTDNGSTEPVGWVVNEVAANCGLLSAFALAKSQADDGSASGGEEWLVWASSSGGRIFGGREPAKISQEIQPDWATINTAAQGCVAVLNDPVGRTLYFALPTGEATAPNLLFTMSYRELDSAESIASAAPYRTGTSGRLVATDNARKWSKWNVKANALSLMYHSAGKIVPTVCGGDGVAPADGGAAHGNVYTLDADQLTDDDYGQIYPYYVTYFFPSPEQAAALGLGAHRMQAQYLAVFISGVGQVTYTILADSLTNPWPLTGVRDLSLTPTFDQEWGAGYAQGQRMAVKITPTPKVGTDVQYTLQRLVLTMKAAARMPVRGAAR